MPSVTEILDAVGLGWTSFIPRDKKEYVLKRGRALHSAIELDATRELDEASIHPDIAGRFEGYRKWVRDTGHVVEESEIELIHSIWNFVGHPDRVGMNRGNRVMVDWKSSVDKDVVIPQMAGYGLLWRDRFPKLPIDQYIALELRPDGTYSSHHLDPRTKEQVFLAALVIHQERQRRAKVSQTVPV